ncbi:GNAT family N-acetyltransferase [Spirosoma sp. HMF4905]|uniref:GNAT family N-acetyltransferase n=1 Tax=Spirosoma arboris TaxID=2682092 RepID=A0A7K1SB58_9BACT|nr:GNAT family N-acetyltransferase [Spirosoma arboris]MVM30995.1 GNAT family N-acetyltransferase [Spirosoma arboris]
MDNYTIIRQQNPQPPDIRPFCQHGFLFNERDHLRQQAGGQFYLLTALNQTTQLAEARCAFFIRSNEAISPAAAPFGSVEFAETLPELVLDTFLNSLIDFAYSAKATLLRIVNYPTCYAPKQATILTISLLKYGFHIQETSQNFFLPITNQPFDCSIAPAERRRLRKCRDADFQFIHWATPNLYKVTEFLQKTRRQKGYPLTLSPEQLIKLVQSFPEQFIVFAVESKAKLVALTVAVRVRHDILYNFLPASHIDYQTFSPMVMLIDGLFSYCQQQQIRLLDLGVALDNNRQPKPGLIRFKRNLGAKESPKLIFEKQL